MFLIIAQASGASNFDGTNFFFGFMGVASALIFASKKPNDCLELIISNRPRRFLRNR